jgi:hypothetical protein
VLNPQEDGFHPPPAPDKVTVWETPQTAGKIVLQGSIGGTQLILNVCVREVVPSPSAKIK